MSEINNLSYYLKKLEKASRRKKLINVGINETKNIKTIKKYNETKNQLFEKFNKIDKPLEKLSRKEDTS